MKKKWGSFLNIHIYFTLIVMAEILITLGCAVILANVLNGWIFVRIPPLVWVFLLSAVIGTVFSLVVNRIIFAPITKLSEYMERVAKGDFKISPETDSEITEIKEIYHSFSLMTQELGATEILQTDFVSNVSHEFKTPINAIEGYATLLQDKSLTEQERDEYTEKILLNTNRLSELVGNILLLSKIDNQAIQTYKTGYKLDEQIRHVILLLEPKWTKKNIDFDVDLEDVTYVGNEALMRHVWSNLIDNAVKFAPQDGFVKMSLSRRENVIIFTIEDNGPGVDEQAQKHIFDKFYQSDSSHKGEGNGLGLALVKKILDLNGGEAKVENLSQGGCRFTITLKEI